MNKQQIQQQIVDQIYENVTQEIGGDILQQVLLNILTLTNDGLSLGGVVNTNSYPLQDTNVFYLTTESGYFTNFDLLISDDAIKIGVIRYDKTEEKYVCDVLLSGNFVKSIIIGSTTTTEPGSMAVVTNSGTRDNLILNFYIPRGDDGQDGTDAVNPFKGWWLDLATLKDAITAEPGDSAYVKDASPATTWSIYVYGATASSDNYWADSGTDADTSNVQTFASGEEVNETYIDDTHLANPKDGALPKAEDVMLLNSKLGGLDFTETKVTPSSTKDSYYIRANNVDASNSNYAYGTFNVQGAKRVRFLGFIAAVEYAGVSGFCFVDTNLNLVKGFPYDNDNSLSSSLQKEYLVDVPEGAVYLKTNIKCGLFTQEDFYCYTQEGDNVGDIFDNLNLEVNGGTIVNTDKHNYTEYTYGYLYQRSNNARSAVDSTHKSILVEIPKGTQSIECIGNLNSSTYYGIAWLNANMVCIGGVAAISGTRNIYSGVISNIPVNAKYVSSQIDATTYSTIRDYSCYIKFNITRQVVGLQQSVNESIADMEDKIDVLDDKTISSEIDYDSSYFSKINFAFSTPDIYGSVNNFDTTDYLQIPENTKKIVAVVAKSNYYNGLTFLKTNNYNSEYVVGHYQANGSTNAKVEINIEDVPSTAKYLMATGRHGDISSCYVKFMTETIEKGLVSRVDDVEDDIEEIQGELSNITSTTLYNGVVSPQVVASTLGDAEELSINTYPRGSKSRGETIAFRANVTTFSKILLGKCNSQTGFGSNYSSWLEIDNTNIVIKKNTGDTAKTIAHGLTIQSVINVIIAGNDDGSVKIILSTVGNQFTTTVSLYGGDGGNTAWQSNNAGYIRVKSDGSTLTKCKLTIANKHIRDPFWIFGASFDSTHDTTNWPYYAFQDGYEKYYINAIPGRGSEATYNDLLLALNLGTPKYLLWTMWGNDTAAELNTYIHNVKAICDENGIVLIIVDRPNSTNASDYAAKKAVIDTYINAGVRYWDIADAVSSNPSDANSWYEGYLQDDGKHPTALGSKAMATQLFADVPEVMQF